MISYYQCLVSFFILIVGEGFLHAHSALVEEERLEEFYRRNHTWPAVYNPSTEGWKKINDRRFAQISQIENSGQRYEGYLQTVMSAIVAPNFTENGWGLTRAPQGLVDDLRQAIRDGLADATPEGNVEVIEGLSPLFIKRKDLTNRVLHELLPMHEEWSKIKLKPSNSYGFRLYRNESRLNMHVDKPETHVISSILHIDHSKDSDPWPLVIEDFQGNTVEIVLEAGDMLFYESSKCFHGRPTKFNGSWYTSVFTHYQPADPEWKKSDRSLSAHYAIPSIWIRSPKSMQAGFKQYEMMEGEVQSRLQMVGTSMKEPECEHNWCGLSNSIKYFGPATFGEVLTADGSTEASGGNEEL